MTGATQLRGARVLIGIDQRELTQKSDLFLTALQSVDASKDIARGNVAPLKRSTAFDRLRADLIARTAAGPKGGYGSWLSGPEKGDWSGRTDDWMPLRSLAA